jgi:MFS family permease
MDKIHDVKTVSSRIVGLLLVVTLGLAVGLRLFVLHTGCAGIPAADDECITVLQAKQIANGSLPLLFLGQPYGFPLDAYLMSPIMNILPRTAFGARLTAFVLGLLSLLLGLLILRRWGRIADTWPGILLLLFGSTFLLILQSGSALPGYPTLILLASAVLWMAQRQGSDDTHHPLWMALVAGVLTGVACSVTMLALPILIMAGIMMGLHRGWRTARWAVPVFALGGFVGLLPHALVAFLHPGAREVVFQAQPWKVALKELWSPVLDRTLPAALGIGSPVIAGSSERVTSFKGFALYFGVIWFLLLVVGSWIALARAWTRWRRERWPSLDTGMLVVGISWLCLLLFLASSRSHHRTYRYLILLVWAFPFLVTYLYGNARGLWRGVLAALTILFVVANLSNTVAVLKRWSDPGFADRLKSYDLRAAIDYLDSRGIRHAYATYADAYRITYATDERIVCSQPFNERFPGWPTPFKALVDASTNVAYVLSDAYRFPPKVFEWDMETMGILFRKQTCGHYQVFTDFTDTRSSTNALTEAATASGETAILPSLLTAGASHNAPEAVRMVDESSSFWRSSGYLQQTGMWIAVEWDASRFVQRVLLDHGGSGGDHPESMRVHYRSDDGRWEKASDSVQRHPEPFEFRNGHPVYGKAISRVDFLDPIETRGLKFEIAEPRSDRAWTLNEVSVIVRPDEDVERVLE